jgi:hypothetical protein
MCTTSTILIYSPGTDLYNIGLPLISNYTKNITIQLNPIHSSSKSFININNIVTALKSDPDVASLCPDSLLTIMTSLFVATGSDFTSYFKSIGKASFLNLFFQYSNFITGIEAIGSLADIQQNNRDSGFLAFLRLIGTAYFKKHLSSFVSLNGCETPQQLYNSMETVASQEKDRAWITHIRSTVSQHITSEDQRVPSISALWHHWLRATYVCKLWSNSTLSDIYLNLSLPENSGWLLKDDGSYVIDWENQELQKSVSSNL